QQIHEGPFVIDGLVLAQDIGVLVVGMHLHGWIVIVHGRLRSMNPDSGKCSPSGVCFPKLKHGIGHGDGVLHTNEPDGDSSHTEEGSKRFCPLRRLESTHYTTILLRNQ